MDGNLITFYLLALVAIGAALGMLFSKNSVYSALFLILNFATVAVFYLILGAPFIAMSQVTVYAGAIMVLFLFVIMLLGTERVVGEDTLVWQKPLSWLLAILLVFVGWYQIGLVGVSDAATRAFMGSDFGGPEAIGLELFNQYLLPFEVTSVLLLVAMVGAIVLTKGEGKKKVEK